MSKLRLTAGCKPGHILKPDLGQAIFAGEAELQPGQSF